MQKGKVLSLKNCNDILSFIVKNRELIFLTVFLIGGLFTGVFCCSESLKIYDFAERIFENYINQRIGFSFFSILIKAFLNSVFYLVLAYICGASVFGIALLPTVSFLKGFLYGILIALIYIKYSFRGIALNAILILPPAIVFIIIFLLGLRLSLNFSVCIAKLTLSTTAPSNLSQLFKNFCVKYLVFCLLLLISAAIDAALSVNFLPIFDFI